MNDNAFDKQDAMKEDADNMSEQERAEEAIANELNTDDSVSGMQHLDDSLEEEGDREQQEKLEKLEKELNETKDKYLRLVAEFENFRKRTAKERVELIQTAGRDVVEGLLDVIDDFERADKQMEASTDIEAVKEGLKLIFSKLNHTLQQKGLKVMDCANQPFDPDLHEAITEIPAPSEDMVGKVVDVVQPGYYLNDKLIRYAKVVVGK